MGCGCGLGAYAPPTSTGYATISYMQQALNYLGYTDNAGKPLAVDNNMGVGGPSDQALRKFQKDARLIVDGQYGSQSWTALRAAVAAKQAPGPNPNPPGPGPTPGPGPDPTPDPSKLVTPYGGSTPASSNTTSYLVGGLAVVALLGAFFFLSKKKR